jgi:large subunit ribosomal protein L35
MPKLKTHKGTKKRVKVAKSGGLQRRHSARNHFLQKKSASTKRQFAGVVAITGKSKKNLKRKLGA